MNFFRLLHYPAGIPQQIVQIRVLSNDITLQLLARGILWKIGQVKSKGKLLFNARRETNHPGFFLNLAIGVYIESIPPIYFLINNNFQSSLVKFYFLGYELDWNRNFFKVVQMNFIGF